MNKTTHSSAQPPGNQPPGRTQPADSSRPVVSTQPPGSQVTVQCPGTVANLVCGFDILGMALNAPFDIMEVRLLDEPKIIVTSKDGFPLPSDPAQNTAGAPLLEMMAELNGNSAENTGPRFPHPIGFEVSITKKIKPGSGIGSSAASAAGAVVAANHLLGNIFSK